MTTILIKKKDTAGAPAPGDLTNAAGGTEIAVNTATKRIYTKDSGGNVVELGTNATSSTIDQLTVVTSTTLSYGTANQVQYLNGSKLLVGSANLTFNGTTLVANDFTDSSLTAGRVTYAGTAGNLTDSANLTFNGTTLTAAGFSGPLNGTVGATTPNTGAFTTLSASSTVTLSGGTANGVMYLNGSKVVTTDSVISFNGATLNVNGNTFGRGAGAVVGNIAIGDAPLYNNVSGAASIAIGQYALFSQTTGTQNIAIGTQAGNGITTGNYNLAVGFQSLYANGGSASASNNTAIGYGAQYANLSGAHNVAVGQSTLGALTSGGYNTAVGNAALGSNTTASSNVAVGYQAGYSNQTGGASVYIGYQAGYTNTTSGLNVFVGYAAGNLATGNFNTFIGPASGESMTSGTKNTILGRYSGNQGGLDIRTASNYIVLSDGDGNPRGFFDNAGVFNTGTLRAIGTAVGSFTASNWFIQQEDGSTTRSYACGPDTSTYARWEHYTTKSNGTPVLTQRWDANANIAVNNIGLGFATPTTSGTGITFPATQSASSNANTLDDYEEGTFSPTIANWSGTYANQAGWYTKTGRMVTCYGWCKTNASTGSFGASFLDLGGLPFAALSGTSGQVSVNGTWAVPSGATSLPTGYLAAGVIDGPWNGGTAGFSNIYVANGNVANASITYFSAATSLEYRFQVIYFTN